jgi:hypothetical protein
LLSEIPDKGFRLKPDGFEDIHKPQRCNVGFEFVVDGNEVYPKDPPVEAHASP